MSSVEQVEAKAAHERVAAGAFLLDVREPYEWQAGHSPDAHHVALGNIPDHLDDIPADTEILVVCRSGSRSNRAAAFLAAQNRQAANVAGGMNAWADADLPMVAEGGVEPHVA